MYTKDFNYNLPPKLIAQRPATPRDSSRLMVVNRGKQTIQRRHFFDIVNYLSEGDLVVWNNSKVFKARLKGEVVLDDATDGLPSLPAMRALARQAGFPRRGRPARYARASVAGGGGLPSSEVVTDGKPHPTPAGASPWKGEEVKPTGRILSFPPVEIFLVRPMENKYVWKVLAKPGRRLRLGMKVKFASDFVGEVMLKENDGTILMQFAEDDLAVRAKANKYGFVPVPPYIRISPLEGGKGDVGGAGLRTAANIPHEPPSRGDLSERYQTVYAKREGSVAAPTAGFHFTPELIEKLKNKGVQFAEVTLHVGLGTFLPVKSERVEDHVMHSEWVELTAKNADLINAAKSEGRRVIAIGTTTVRTLEGVALLSPPVPTDEGRGSRPDVGTRGGVASEASGGGGSVRPYTGDLNLFITPGFKFQIVDALITNFHLPKSTLLMLVCAFVGDTKFVLECYKKAIEEKYRFYSFGDAMLIF